MLVYLHTLSIQNVRNLHTTEISFSPGLNFISGANGAGKTALLEAIHILSRGRSFRGGGAGAVITHDESQMIIRGDVVDPGGLDKRLAILRTRAGATEIKIAGEKERRVSSLAKILPVQVLLPDAAQLIYAGPSARRGFIDWGLFHVEQEFLPLYSRYRRVLAQRNAWLKAQNVSVVSRGGDRLEEPWSRQLIEAAVPLQKYRSTYVQELEPYVAKLLSRLNIDERKAFDVTISYRSGGLESIEEAEKTLVESLPRDVKLGTTQRGPHRSDLVFRSDEHAASEVLSRGQAKLLAGACILAQAEHLYRKTGTKSVFLVDDFGAELDRDHWQVLLDTLMNLESQVIATGTTGVEFEAMVKRDRANTGPHSGRVADMAAEEATGVVSDNKPAPKAASMFHVEHGFLTPVDAI